MLANSLTLPPLRCSSFIPSLGLWVSLWLLWLIKYSGSDATWFWGRIIKGSAFFTITLILGGWTSWLPGNHHTVRNHKPRGKATCKPCKWLEDPVIPGQVPNMKLKEPPDNSSPRWWPRLSLWVFLPEAPDITDQRRAMPCSNPWPTEYDCWEWLHLVQLVTQQRDQSSQSRSEKAMHYRITTVWCSGKSKTVETVRRWVVVKGEEEERMNMQNTEDF